MEFLITNMKETHQYFDKNFLQKIVRYDILLIYF